MKKTLIAIFVLVIIAAAAVLAGQAMRKAGKAYVLAEELKSAGLPVGEITVKENSSMYNEVRATGEGLNLKIGYYGNGLFMDEIVRNLETGKKRGPDDIAPAILATRLFILVVYAEPEKGIVKKLLAEKFGQVREY